MIETYALMSTLLVESMVIEISIVVLLSSPPVLLAFEPLLDEGSDVPDSGDAPP